MEKRKHPGKNVGHASVNLGSVANERDMLLTSDTVPDGLSWTVKIYVTETDLFLEISFWQ